MLNTNEFEWADVKVNMLGITLTGLRGLKYKKAQEKEPVYAAGNEAKSIQRGNKRYDGTLRLLKSDFDTLNRAAIAAGYEDIVDVPGKLINITCVYKKEGVAGIATAALINVEFTECEDGLNQNDKFSEVSLPFIALKVRYA